MKSNIMRITVSLLVFLLVLIVHAQSSETSDPITEKLDSIRETIRTSNYAIIIGINDYASKNIVNLTYSEKDAECLAAVLKNQGWDPEKILLLTGKDATYENIYDALFNLSKMQTVPENASILFFFSGQGVSAEGINYLLPYDGSARDALISVRNIDLDIIEKTIGKSPFEQKIIILDANRGEVSRESKSVTSASFDNVQEYNGTRIILSTAQGEYAREDENLQSGVFSHFLIKGLSDKEADIDDDCVVVISELELYIAKNMDAYSFKTGVRQSIASRGEASPLIPLAVVTTQDKGIWDEGHGVGLSEKEKEGNSQM